MECEIWGHCVIWAIRGDGRNKVCPFCGVGKLPGNVLRNMEDKSDKLGTLKFWVSAEIEGNIFYDSCAVLL